MEDYRVFQECGLTEGEAKVYFALLELERATAGQIAKKTALQRSVVYYCIDALLKKGLISFMVKNNVHYYHAESSKKLFNVIQERKRKLDSAEKSVEKMMEQIEEQRKKLVISPGRVFMGWSGLKTAFQDVVNTMNRGEEYYVYGISQRPVPYDRFQRFLGNFHKIRGKKGIRAKILIAKHLKSTVGKARESEQPTEVRYFESEEKSPAIFYVYKHKVMMSMWVEEPFALIIENKEIADALRNYFLVMWKKFAT